MAAHRIGVQGLYDGYVLLGDDIVIFEEDVALEYQEIMTWLGVTINLTKSVVGTGIAEFAKRHFYQGHEISGVPGKLILLAGTHLGGLRVLIETVLQRGWKVSLGSVLCSYTLHTDWVRCERLWRYLLISIGGPGAPFSQQALWGGIWCSPLEFLLWTSIGATPDLIPASTASTCTQLPVEW
jgi:hypothetical protein